jgi:protocatechuate 3,4-dioxygenase beta subunit
MWTGAPWTTPPAELPMESYAKALHTANHPRIMMSAPGAEEKSMKPDTISLRRRHLLIAGAAAPATLFAAHCRAAGNAPAAGLSATAGGGAERLVVSGRILGADGKPLSGARVEVLHAPSSEGTGVNTDADGRFLFATTAPVGSSGPRPLRYRVSDKGHQTRATQLDAAQLRRDDAGAWRGTFAVTLAA